MTPDKADLVLAALTKSIDAWIDEVEVLAAIHGNSAIHLLASMRQTRLSLQQLIGRNKGVDESNN